MTSVLILFLTLMLAIEGYLVFTYVERMKYIDKCNKWPLVTAQVVSIKIVEKKVPIGGGKGVATGSLYIPEIDYIFSVMGKDYEQHARLQRRWTSSMAGEIPNSIGKTIDVHYNPENPAENSPELVKGHFIDEFFRIILLGLFSLGILIFLFLNAFHVI